MDDVASFRTNVVRPVLQRLGLWSEVSENLMVGTALQESLLTYTQQVGGGPALGYFQMEPFTHDDCWKTFLNLKPDLSKKVKSFLTNPLQDGIPDAREMITNPYYACAMARIKYYRVRAALPTEPTDIVGIANYWKQWYNTPLGAGKPQEFVDKYVKYGQQ